MAYGRRYQMQWRSINQTGWLYIEENNYSGAAETLSLLNDAISLTRDFSNWETHLIGQTCEFNIVNDKDDFFSLKPLMVSTERKYKILVYAYEDIALTEVKLFEGWVNTEAVQQKYLQKQTIKMVASSFVLKLKYVYPTSLDNLGTVTFIDAINEILLQAGNTFPIRVASFLVSNGGETPINKSFMNQNGIYNELFWVNNIDREDSETILKNILTSFDCYMYYWDGYWYIEDFTMLWKTDKAYIQYEIDQSYSPVDNGLRIPLVFTIGDIQDLYFMSKSQIISVKPGKRQVIVRIDDSPFYSLTSSSFTNIIRIPAWVYVEERQWYAFQPDAQTLMVWEDEGLPHLSMIDSIKRTSTFNNIEGDNNIENYPYRDGGLQTAFVLTKDEQTTLDIKWLYATSLSTMVPELNFVFRFHLYMYDMDGNYFGQIFHNSNGVLVFDGSTGGLIEILVSGVDFETNGVGEVSISIPFADLENAGLILDDSYRFVIRIWTEFGYATGGRNENRVWNEAYYGDVQITVSTGEFPDNYIEGTANTDFIEKQEITVEIADMPNFNYKNGILTGDNLNALTEFWYRDDVEQRQLVDYILINKFRMANVSRQRITARLKNTTGKFIRPFSMFIDPLDDNKKYLLTGMKHNVTKDEYEVTLDEYDNDTPIDLIEE